MSIDCDPFKVLAATFTQRKLGDGGTSGKLVARVSYNACSYTTRGEYMSRIDSDDDNDIIQFCLFPRYVAAVFGGGGDFAAPKYDLFDVCRSYQLTHDNAATSADTSVGRAVFSLPDFCHVLRVTSFNSLSLNCPPSLLLADANFYTAASGVPARCASTS